MVAVNHIPHLVHTQTAFVWRFLALSAGESQIIHVTARRNAKRVTVARPVVLLYLPPVFVRRCAMINLSLTDLNRIQFREKFTGQLLVNVDKGRVVCNYHLPDEAIVATRESLQEITKRAGMINTNIQGCFMHNKTTPDAAAEAIKTLMHALIDISVIADRAHKHATSETEYAGAFVPHSLAVMQFSADTALNEAKAILIADCENGGYA